MLKLNKVLIELIKDNNLGQSLLNGNFGLEKESVRVTHEGKLAKTPHPKTFGDKSKNPYITTDFSESQVEVITPRMDSLEEAHSMLETLQNIVSLHLEDELLWPQSTPPILPDEEDIPIAQFKDNDSNDDSYIYRKGLAEKYGRKNQMISGIHYNFSFKERFLKKLYNASTTNESYRSYKDALYMKMMRNITKNSWFIIRLLGSSPAIHESYRKYCESCSNNASIRNGECGYKNHRDFYVSLDSVESYIKSLRKLIDSGELISDKEYYGVVRPKNSKGNLESIEKEGIEYLELRFLDINPLFKVGVSLDDLYLIQLFLLFSALSEDDSLDKKTFEEAVQNNRYVADNGRKKSLNIRLNSDSIPIKEASLILISRLREIVALVDEKQDFLNPLVDRYKDMINDHRKLYSNILYDQIKSHGFIQYHLKKAVNYLAMSKKQEFNFIGYEDLELSTQILLLDAIRRGVKFEILDRHENFIRLNYDDKTEVVKQATKTSKDNYSTVLVMENKIVTKKILESANLVVPKGVAYENIEDATSDYAFYKNKAIVIKPNTTNFGIGITIFKNDFSQADYKRALKLAFNNDQTILIEEFMSGKEYRVFVIGDEVVGVLHRVPANVTGDGVNTIKDLVIEKNKSPLRGSGYRKPLQKINLGLEEEMFLAQQNLNFDTILEKGEIAFLRENSNISTGGDSIDFTDQISSSLKEVAVKAAKAVGAEITGVDLITEDITGDAEGNYGIIELNFNPAIHIHCYPYKGKNRKLGDKLLDLLGFSYP